MKYRLRCRHCGKYATWVSDCSPGTDFTRQFSEVEYHCVIYFGFLRRSYFVWLFYLCFFFLHIKGVNLYYLHTLLVIISINLRAVLETAAAYRYEHITFII